MDLRAVERRKPGVKTKLLVLGRQDRAMPGEVRVTVLAAGVSLPKVLAREDVHPGNTARVLYTRRYSTGGAAASVMP